TTKYFYSPAGDLTMLITPKSTVFTFEYNRYTEQGQPPVVQLSNPLIDEYGRVTRVQYPDGANDYFGYNLAGEPAWSARKYGNTPTTSGYLVTSYVRDQLHRMTRVDVPASLQGVPGFTKTASF